MNEIRVNQIINLIDGSFSAIENGKKTAYKQANLAEGIYTSYDIVKSIGIVDGELVIEVENVKKKEEERKKESKEYFIKKHKEKYGVEPNMFDGV